MTEAPKKPYFMVKLEPEKNYAWCACGKSNNQPFCDGSHGGTGITPVWFKVEQEKEYALCGCKATKNQPFCDGTHKTLPSYKNPR